MLACTPACGTAVRPHVCIHARAWYVGPATRVKQLCCAPTRTGILQRPLLAAAGAAAAGDDGNFFTGSGHGRPYGPPFGAGDVIGALYNRSDRSISYFKVRAGRTDGWLQCGAGEGGGGCGGEGGRAGREGAGSRQRRSSSPSLL